MLIGVRTNEFSCHVWKYQRGSLAQDGHLIDLRTALFLLLTGDAKATLVEKWGGQSVSRDGTWNG